MKKFTSRILLASLLSFTLLGTSTVSMAQSSAVARGLPNFADLVETVGPSVVFIRTGGKSKVETSDSEQTTPRFRRRPAQPDEKGDIELGFGSGFIISPDGFILTNNHVILGADQVIVRLLDKREFKARVLGSDERSDVALIKIDAVGLTPMKIGNPNVARVGEWVLAIGAPFGMTNSVSAGIISSKGRDIDGELLPAIQSDVAVNPGNSGGPLVNLNGEVIGINSQIFSLSGGYMGISFAIPIDEALLVSSQLQRTGKVVRGRIGIRISDIDRSLSTIGETVGAMVEEVEPNGPADVAGLKPKDIILSVDGKPVQGSPALSRMISKIAPGTSVNVRVTRAAKLMSLKIIIGE